MSDNAPTIEVEIDGKKHTVPRPDGLLSQAEVDQGYLPREVVNEVYVPKSDMKTAINERFKNWVKREDAVSDPDIISSVLKENPSNEGGPADLEAAKAAWQKTDVDPLLGRIDSLLSMVKGNEIRGAAQEVFDDPWVKQPRPGHPSYVETVFGSQLVFDEDLQYHVALDDNGNKIPANKPTAARPYADAAEFLAMKAQDDAFRHLRRPPETNNSSGYGGENGQSGGGPGNDPSKYPPRSTMSDVDKLAAIKELGHEGFMKIPFQAKT